MRSCYYAFLAYVFTHFQMWISNNMYWSQQLDSPTMSTMMGTIRGPCLLSKQCKWIEEIVGSVPDEQKVLDLKGVKELVR